MTDHVNQMSVSSLLSLSLATSEQAILPRVYDLLDQFIVSPSYACESQRNASRFAHLRWQHIETGASNQKFLETYQQAIEQNFPSSDFAIRFRALHTPFSIGIVSTSHSKVLECLLASQAAFAVPELAIDFVASSNQESELIADRFGIPFYQLPDADPHIFESEIIRLSKRFKVMACSLLSDEHKLSAQTLNEIDCPVIALHAVDVKGKPCAIFDDQSVNDDMLVSAYSLQADANLLFPLAQKHICTSVSAPQPVRQCASELLFAAFNKYSHNRVIEYQNEIFVFEQG